MEPEVGYFYEINHTKLPLRSPIQLKSIRIVMVTEKTPFNVSVKFPTSLSLRTYFGKDSSNGSPQDLAGNGQPVLDEQFVITSRVAREVLMRHVPSSELLKQKHLLSFWLATPLKVSENPSCVAKEGLGKCAGQVTFIRRHKEKTPQPFLASMREAKEDEKVEMEIKTEEKKKTRKKRKRESSNRIRKAKSCGKREREKPSGFNGKRQKLLKGENHRWSEERYNLSEQKLVEIMKEKGAVVGHPMLRAALRQESRKQIGDTGLLDHLLKHMAGKVAPGGKERFRRRHNPEGTMEYWLESADLINIPKEAGVNDPYWIPPPGWKRGDSPSQHGVCLRELSLLKEEMATMKGEVQELLSKKQQEEDATVDVEANGAPRSTINHSQSVSATVVTRTRKEMSKNLGKREAQLEEQLDEFSNSLKEMQEELGRLSSSLMHKETARSEVVAEQEEEEEIGAKQKDAAAVNEGGKAAEAEAAAKAEKKQRLQSGFRICKPHGTFNWPNMNMVGSGGPPCSSSSHPPSAQAQDDDLLMVSTPTSGSSATNVFHPLPPTTPSNVSFAAVENEVSVVNNSTSTTIIGADHATSEVTEQYHRQDHRHQNRQAGSWHSSVGTWLALATPNPYLDGPNLFP
ncbi:hypothetical protein NE237_028582 [Protea cynaroides]|uniref:PTC1-like winged helix-turn-helix domain-containing protein n=1 Tax=Protea cynaroides TaxID=273540 RepID=A0A9Q0GQL9_9MAGN|nr:hypothetical protein NE237_028582 [Protea cynaroides]